MTSAETARSEPKPATAPTAAFGAPGGPVLARLIALAAIVLSAAEIAYLLFGVEAAAPLGRAAWVALALLATPYFGFREWAMTAAAAALAVALVSAGDLDGLAVAFERAGFYSAFILLMTMLREAAITSPAVRAVGRFATHQPAGRRYAATALGAHGMGVLLNFGALSLLAPMIQSGVRSDPIETEADQRRVEIRERRQLSAMIRGFSWVIAWAPTTLTQAIIIASLPSIDVGRLMLLGILAAALIFVVGYLEDYLRWRSVMRRAATVTGERPPVAALWNMAAVCLFLIGATYAIRAIFDVATTVALMLAAPMMLVGWVFFQNSGRGPGAAAVAVVRRLGEIRDGPLPILSRDAYILGAAGFIGNAAASLAPVEAIAEATALDQADPFLFLTALPVIVVLAGQIAISPMMVVVFLGGVISSLPTPPADLELIGLALGAGWALSLTGAPNATGTIMLSSVTGLPTTRLTWAWNGVFTLLALLTMSALFFVLTRLG